MISEIFKREKLAIVIALYSISGHSIAASLLKKPDIAENKTHFLVVDMKPIKSCAEIRPGLPSPTEGPNGNVLYVLRMRIPPNFDLQQAGRKITQHKSDDGRQTQSDADRNGHMNSQGRKDEIINNDLALKRDPFHIYTSNLYDSVRGGDQYVKIRIVLRNQTQYKFSEINYNGRLISAVGVLDDTVQNVCSPVSVGKEGPLIDPNRDGKLIAAVFYVKIIPVSTGVYENSLSVIVQAGDYAETPILIDPKIQNHG